MTATVALFDVPGGADLVGWFGHVPRFHDAELVELSIAGNGSGLLRLHAWNMTDQVDAAGHYILDNPATVTFLLEKVTAIGCTDLDLMPAIVFRLDITLADVDIRIAFIASYGADGFISARQARITVVPGKPS